MQWSNLFSGTLVTINLFFITILLSFPLGLVVMLLQNSKNAVVSKVTNFFVLVLRGTPLLLQVFFIYYGMPVMPVIGKLLVFDRFPACCVAFVLNYAAYFAQIFRGGLLAVDKGQQEASKVLGLTKSQTFFKILLPQMLRVSLPAISNEAIILVKDTALVTAIGVKELLQVTKDIVNTTYSIMPFFVAAVFYLVMSWVLTVLFNYLEKRYSFNKSY